jgi:hypothetical protein
MGLELDATIDHCGGECATIDVLLESRGKGQKGIAYDAKSCQC